MDEIKWTYQDHNEFAKDTEGQSKYPRCPETHNDFNWYEPDKDTTSEEDRTNFLCDLKAGKPRAQAYLAEIIAWRMNRE